tara:strand:- start:392 stop:532 length:141 start_codon:yes stop_codon:yes gene_type:complete
VTLTISQKPTFGKAEIKSPSSGYDLVGMKVDGNPLSFTENGFGVDG